MPHDVAVGTFRQCAPLVTRLTLVVSFTLPVQTRNAVPGHDVVRWCSSWCALVSVLSGGAYLEFSYVPCTVVVVIRCGCCPSLPPVGCRCVRCDEGGGGVHSCLFGVAAALMWDVVSAVTWVIAGVVM